MKRAVTAILVASAFALASVGVAEARPKVSSAGVKKKEEYAEAKKACLGNDDGLSGKPLQTCIKKEQRKKKKKKKRS